MANDFVSASLSCQIWAIWISQSRHKPGIRYIMIFHASSRLYLEILLRTCSISWVESCPRFVFCNFLDKILDLLRPGNFWRGFFPLSLRTSCDMAFLLKIVHNLSDVLLILFIFNAFKVVISQVEAWKVIQTRWQIIKTVVEHRAGPPVWKECRGGSEILLEVADCQQRASDGSTGEETLLGHLVRVGGREEAAFPRASSAERKINVSESWPCPDVAVILRRQLKSCSVPDIFRNQRRNPLP